MRPTSAIGIGSGGAGLIGNAGMLDGHIVRVLHADRVPRTRLLRPEDDGRSDASIVLDVTSRPQLADACGRTVVAEGRRSRCRNGSGRYPLP